MNWIADIIDRHRRSVCGLVILLTAVALVGISRLDFSMNPSSDIRGDDTDWRILEEFYNEFDPDGLALHVPLLKRLDNARVFDYTKTHENKTNHTRTIVQPRCRSHGKGLATEKQATGPTSVGTTFVPGTRSKRFPHGQAATGGSTKSIACTGIPGILEASPISGSPPRTMESTTIRPNSPFAARCTPKC